MSQYMTATHSLKVRQDRSGRFNIYFFTQEASGRSYGGRIVATADTVEQAVQIQNNEAWSRGLTIIPFFG